MQIIKTVLLAACVAGLAIAGPVKRAGASCGLQKSVSHLSNGAIVQNVSQISSRRCSSDSVCCVPSKGPDYDFLIKHGHVTGFCQPLEADEAGLSCFS